jgi:uncharacterized protein (TIGR02118 family)
MATISVIYPRSEGGRFDFDYYERTHLPLVAARWGGAGLTGAQALRGVAAPGGGEAELFAIALVSFGSMEQLQAAVDGEHAAEIMGDIANFTDVAPLVQVNESIG